MVHKIPHHTPQESTGTSCNLYIQEGGVLTAATGKCVDDGSILLILTNEREFNKPKT